MKGVGLVKFVKYHSLTPSSLVLPSCITLHLTALNEVTDAEVTCRVDGTAKGKVVAALDLAWGESVHL